jgi:hypothetical protein
VRRTNPLLLTAALFILATSCKKEETVVPEDDTWTPDENNEPAAATPDVAPQLSEEEKAAKAKELYVEAEAKAKAEDWTAALGLYEQAYYLVPTKHGFALKVAQAADKTGDCTKAVQYFEHFVQYADPEKYGDDLKVTKKRLEELKKKCG